MACGTLCSGENKKGIEVSMQVLYVSMDNKYFQGLFILALMIENY